MAEPHIAGPQRWVCTICGFIYDPALYDGVAFENLPDGWLCPGCGFGKDVFVPAE